MITTEQRQVRLGHVTASKFADVMTEPRTKKDKESGKLSGTATTYMNRLIHEVLTGETPPEINTASIRWGNENEPRAIEAYEHMTGERVTETDFIPHPTLPYVGATPDGLLGDDGLLEIKCPYNGENHVETLKSLSVPKQYYAQVQGQLWVTGRKYAKFLSYDPRIADPYMGLVIIPVERDVTFINKLEAAVVAFSLKLLQTLKEISQRNTPDEYHNRIGSSEPKRIA